MISIRKGEYHMATYPFTMRLWPLIEQSPRPPRSGPSHAPRVVLLNARRGAWQGVQGCGGASTLFWLKRAGAGGASISARAPVATENRQQRRRRKGAKGKGKGGQRRTTIRRRTINRQRRRRRRRRTSSPDHSPAAASTVDRVVNSGDALIILVSIIGLSCRL